MKKVFLVVFILVIALQGPGQVYAMELDEYDFGELDEFFDKQENMEDFSFKGLVRELMEKGLAGMPDIAVSWLDEMLLREIRQNQGLLGMVMALSLMSAVFVNFAMGFENSQVSRTAMLITRLFNVVLLMWGFNIVFGVMNDFFSQLVDFINSILPVYVFSVTFSTGSVSGVGLKQGTMLLITLLNYGIRLFLLPMIHVFVSMELINTITPDNSFHKMCQLIKSLIIWANNSMLAMVAGMNVIKAMVAPYADKTATIAFQKAVSLIPGIGSGISGASELILGTGKFIRNSIGAAGLIVIVILCAVPVVKTAVFSVLYRFCGALVEPVADKTMVEGISGVGEGVMLLLRISVTGATLCMLTIGMVCV